MSTYHKVMILPLIDTRFRIKEDFNFGEGLRITGTMDEFEEEIKSLRDYLKIKNVLSDKSVTLKVRKWLVYEYESLKEGTSDEDEVKWRLIESVIIIFRLLYASILNDEFRIIFTKKGKNIVRTSFRYNPSKVRLHLGAKKYVITYTKKHLVHVKKLYTNYFTTLRNEDIETNRIVRALSFFKIASEEELGIMKFVNNAIALECIFSTSQGELTYKLRQRIAWFLGKSVSERIVISDKIKDILKIRGIILHGEKLGSQKKLFNGISIDLETYLVQALTKILKSKKLINIFRSTKDHNRINSYFDHIVLNKKF